MSKNTAVFGIYPTQGSVESSVDALKTAGFRNTDISVLFPENVGSARVFLSNAEDRMIEEFAIQTEGVLRRLDKRFRAVLFLEGRLGQPLEALGSKLASPAVLV